MLDKPIQYRFPNDGPQLLFRPKELSEPCVKFVIRHFTDKHGPAALFDPTTNVYVGPERRKQPRAA
jgi:hypothetical protein